MNAPMEPGMEFEDGFFVGDEPGDPNGDTFGCIHQALDDREENGGAIFPVLQLHVNDPWGGGITWITTVEKAMLN